MSKSKSSATAPPTTHDVVRSVCAKCGRSARTLQAPRPNVGTGYEGPMYCRECNPRFRALDFHYSSLERLSV